MRQLTETLIESDVQVYSMGVYDRDYSLKHTPEERRGPKLLDEVALDTGGRDFPVSLENLPNVGVQIARELRNQYILGYSPGAVTADGKFHRVSLKIEGINSESGLRTFYRRGYYAPAQ
jgi:Ca-activated chloride channel family protein